MATYNSYSSSMAERKLTIENFTGVDQSRGPHSNDYGSSPDGTNFRTRDGMLMTVGGISKYGAWINPVPGHIGEGRIFQAFFRVKTNGQFDHDAGVFSKLIMTINHEVYAADPGAETWTCISNFYEPGSQLWITSNDWNAINYRDENRDIIMLTNRDDAALYWDGYATTVSRQYLIQDESEDTGPLIRIALHVGQLALLNERLWGGVVKEHLDRIYWSKTFDPLDWDLSFEDSEYEGGGYLDVATFDGSSVRAIMAFMDELLIFKDKSIHRLNGSYPGEFSLSQIFGTEGTLAPRTIVNDGKALYFLTDDGLVKYAGMTATPLEALGDRRLKDIWSRINSSTIQTACAAIMGNIIYLAIPLDGSIINTHVIEYDTTKHTYNILKLAGVEDWLVFREGNEETLLFLSGGQIYRYDTGYTFYNNAPINAVWTTPYISCGTLSSKKQTGRIYMSINATSLDVNRQPSIKLSMLSGDKVRSKIIQLKTGLNEIRKRVKIRGRTFRLKIENQNGDPLTINSGVEIHVEEDFD